MSAGAFKIKSGDTRPSVRALLTDALGAPVDLTGAGVRFRMATIGGTTVVDAAAQIDGTPTGGGVLYAWQPGDTDEPGTFKAEWVVTFADQRRQTYPRGDEFNKIVVGEGIAPIPAGTP